AHVLAGARGRRRGRQAHRRRRRRLRDRARARTAERRRRRVAARRLRHLRDRGRRYVVMSIDRAVAEARTNIALVKYWGKRDAHLNLPAVGSLSLTLDGMLTRTEVHFDAALDGDRFFLGADRQSGKPAERVS